MTSELHDGAESLTEDPLFEALAARSRRTNVTRVEQMVRVLASCRQLGRTGPEECARLADLAHQVVGSAGTFGFGRVSDLGREVEAVLERGEPGEPELTELERLAAVMAAELEPR